MNRSPRNLLLPAWIRFFAWIFLVIGAVGAGIELTAVALNTPSNFMLHGLRYSGPSRAPQPIAIALVLAFYAYTAFLLLWGRKAGRKAGLAAGYIGLVLCVTGLVVSLSRGSLYIPLEPIFQVPFVVKLHRLKTQWDEEPTIPNGREHGEVSHLLS